MGENNGGTKRNKDYSDSESEPRSIGGMGSSASSLSSSWPIGVRTVVAWVIGRIEAVAGFGPTTPLPDGNGSGGGCSGDCAICPVSAGWFARGAGDCGCLSPTEGGAGSCEGWMVTGAVGASTCMGTVSRACKEGVPELFPVSIDGREAFHRLVRPASSGI